MQGGEFVSRNGHRPKSVRGNAGGRSQAGFATCGDTGARTAGRGQGCKAPRLSIVVLPFENPERRSQRGLPGRRHHRGCDHRPIPRAGMFVIARQSAYTCQGKAVDVRKIGEELGVR